MSEATRSYKVDDRRTAEAVVHHLENLGLVSRRRASVRRTFLDTVDWGAFRRRQAIWHETDGRGARLEVRSLDNGLRPIQAPLDHPPRLASDVPLPGLRQRLDSLVGFRRLFPFLEVSCQQRAFELRDKNAKVVCRVTLERCRARGRAGGVSRRLSRRVVVDPIRGYAPAAERVASELERSLGLEPARQGLLEEALERLRIDADPGPAGAPPAVEGGTSAGAAVGRVFAQQLRVLAASLDGVRNDYDPEFLHDFRVAVRKTRALLGQVGQLLPEDAWERFGEDFSWLSRNTSPVRDLDVYILGFDELKARVPGEMREHLLPVLAVLKARKREGHRRLVEALDSPRYRALVEDWSRLVLALDESPEPAWREPVRDLAGRRVSRLHRRLLREGRALNESAEDERYHRLRKTCKKLRYLLESFESSLGGREARRLVKSLKRLQGELGRHQDCAVQAATFRRLGEQMQASGEPSAGTIMAVGVLVDRLNRDKNAHRAAFRRRFQTFARKGPPAAAPSHR